MNYLRNRRPTFTVQRDDLAQGGHPWFGSMTDEDRGWFRAHYSLVRTFRYSDAIAEAPAWLRFVLRLGTHSPYFLYRWSG